MKKKIFLVVVIVILAILTVGSWIMERNHNLSQDFRMYFGQELPKTPEAKVRVEPAVTRELFKARFEMEHSGTFNLAKLGSKFFDLCETAQKAGFEKEIKAADCPTAKRRG